MNKLILNLGRELHQTEQSLITGGYGGCREGWCLTGTHTKMGNMICVPCGSSTGDEE